MSARNRVLGAASVATSGARRLCQGMVIACVALHAMAARADSGMTGFLVTWTGEFDGRVADADGKPLRGVAVHVVAKDGAEHTVTTDARGRYHLSVQRGQYVYVNDQVQLSTQAAITVAVGHDGLEEAVELHEFMTPLVQPVAPRVFGDQVILDYSDAAIARNQWAKVWLILDVLPTGSVARVQLLKPAGYDLDPIAVREAFKLVLEPARDAGGGAIKAMTLWSFEWPPYYWLMEHDRQHFNMHRMPSDAHKLPCQGDGPARPVYRDCSLPDLRKVVSAPWIDRPKP